MIYELRVSVFLKDRSVLRDILQELERRKRFMKVVKPGTPQQQCSMIDVIKCRHDESPVEPCTLVSHWDNCPSVSPVVEPSDSP